MTTTKAIERPEWLSDKPKGFSEAKFLKRCSTGFGLPIEIFELPLAVLSPIGLTRTQQEPQIVVVDCQLSALRRYAVYSSLRAWEIQDHSHACRDIEGHGGRFYPSDYSRLKITRKTVPSEVSATGWQHAPACECQGCRELVHYHHAKYAHSEADGYLPFCEECYNGLDI